MCTFNSETKAHCCHETTSIPHIFGGKGTCPLKTRKKLFLKPCGNLSESTVLQEKVGLRRLRASGAQHLSRQSLRTKPGNCSGPEGT